MNNYKGKSRKRSTNEGKSRYSKDDREYDDSKEESGDRRKYTKDRGNIYTNTKGTGRRKSGSKYSETNDPSWYAQSAQLLSDSSSVPYSWPLNKPLDVFNATVVPGTFDHPSAAFTNPGIMTVRVALTPGKAVSESSPVNVATKNIYSFVRHANSGHSNYEAVDLMLYILTMDSIYAHFYNAVRAYGAMGLYNQQNLYYPKAIIRALGWDYDNLVSNLAQFRFAINAMAVRIGSMCVPDTMPILKRHRWIFSGLYTDSPVPKAQTYAYIPANYYTYEELNGAGYLESHALENDLGDAHLLTVDDWITMMNLMLDPVIASEDMNIMSGDILKAYGADNVYKLDVLSDSFIVVPTFDSEVLAQFHNMSLIPLNLAGDLNSSANITQTVGVTGGTLVYDPSTSIANTSPPSACSLNKVVNFNQPVVTPAETMVATRLSAITVLDGANNLKISSFGTEIATSAVITAYQSDGTYGQWKFSSEITLSPTVAGGGLFPSLLKIAMWSRFDYAPLLYIQCIKDTATGACFGFPCMGDLNTWTVLDANTLEGMHTTAVLSEFDCPRMGSVSNR